MNTEKNYCVRYISGNNSDNYVGSVQDYKNGGQADPVLIEEEEELDYVNTGLDRSVRAMPYIVGRMIAITEHYAVSKFGALTLSNMFTHPRYYIDSFRRYIDKEDMYYEELKDIELPVVIKSPVEQGQIWIGYYHQKSAYEHTHGMTIAERLKSAREKQGMTLQALSQSTCINISNLSKIESGKVDPKLSTVQTICKALGLKLTIE